MWGYKCGGGGHKHTIAPTPIKKVGGGGAHPPPPLPTPVNIILNNLKYIGINKEEEFLKYSLRIPSAPGVLGVFLTL